jgi:hypothetical protein
MLAGLVLWLKRCADEAPHLAPLTAYLAEHLDAVAREEGEELTLLKQYAHAAQRFHGEAWVSAATSPGTGQALLPLLPAVPPPARKETSLSVESKPAPPAPPAAELESLLAELLAGL